MLRENPRRWTAERLWEGERWLQSTASKLLVSLSFPSARACVCSKGAAFKRGGVGCILPGTLVILSSYKKL